MTTTDAFRELATSSAATLERLVQARRGPALASLVGFEWRGYNVPWTAGLLGIRKFVKGFFRTEACAEGYNIPVKQNGLAGPWLERPTPEAPRRYAFFEVLDEAQGSRENRYPTAVLLDYGASARNPAHGIERRLRDYLVQPDPADPDLLLGKAYFALGSARLPVGFFVIERLRPTTWKP